MSDVTDEDREKYKSIGRLAYNVQGESAQCPYPIGSGYRRVCWWIGFLEARTAHALNKFRIVYSLR